MTAVDRESPGEQALRPLVGVLFCVSLGLIWWSLNSVSYGLGQAFQFAREEPSRGPLLLIGSILTLALCAVPILMSRIRLGRRPLLPTWSLILVGLVAAAVGLGAAYLSTAVPIYETRSFSVTVGQCIQVWAAPVTALFTLLGCAAPTLVRAGFRVAGRLVGALASLGGASLVAAIAVMYFQTSKG